RVRPHSSGARMAIVCWTSSFFNRAEVSFQFYGCNRVTWHLHLLEPCGQGPLIGSLHNASIFLCDRLRKLRYGCTVGSFWAACAIWLICSRVKAPAGTLWLLMNLGIIFVLSAFAILGVPVEISGRPAGSKLAEHRHSHKMGSRAP